MPRAERAAFRAMMILLAALLIATGIAIVAAGARPPPKFDPALHQWFESLKEPRTQIGCCSVSDCHILKDSDVRTSRAGYEVRVDGAWFPVPADRVLQRTANPTGGYVACWGLDYDFNGHARPYFYCFVRGVEG